MKKRVFLAAFFILIFVVIIILSKNILFSGHTTDIDQNNAVHFLVTTTVLNNNKEVYSDSELLLNINIIKSGDPGRIDAELEVEIDDSDSSYIKKSLETFSIDSQANIAKRIKVYDNAPPGTYKVKSRVIYKENEVASSSQTFHIIDRADSNRFNYQFIILSMIAASVLLIISSAIIYNSSKKKN